MSCPPYTTNFILLFDNKPSQKRQVKFDIDTLSDNDLAAPAGEKCMKFDRLFSSKNVCLQIKIVLDKCYNYL